MAMHLSLRERITCSSLHRSSAISSASWRSIRRIWLLSYWSNGSVADGSAGGGVFGFGGAKFAASGFKSDFISPKMLLKALFIVRLVICYQWEGQLGEYLSHLL